MVLGYVCIQIEVDYEINLLCVSDCVEFVC